MVNKKGMEAIMREKRYESLHKSGDVCFECLQQCTRGETGEFKSDCCGASIIGRKQLEGSYYKCSECMKIIEFDALKFKRGDESPCCKGGVYQIMPHNPN